MPKEITKFKCVFCRRSYMRRSYAVKHENGCFYNPDRTPKTGELAVFKTMPVKLQQCNSYGVPGSSWMEPKEKRFDVTNEFETTFMWWPKNNDGELLIGFFWNGEKWEEITGYKPPNFSPGSCWEDEVIPDEYLLSDPYTYESRWYF